MSSITPSLARSPRLEHPLPGSGVSVVLVAGHLLFGQCIAEALVGEGFHVSLHLYEHHAATESAVRRLLDPLVVLDLDTAGDVAVSPLVGPLRRQGGRVVVLTSPATHLTAAECVAAGALAAVDKRGPFAPLVHTLLDIARRPAPGPRHHGMRALSGGGAVLTQPTSLVGDLVRARERTQDQLRPFTQLTPAEQDVLAALMDGCSIAEIAEQRVVSAETVRSQVKAVLRKLGVGSQLGAVALARSRGWTPPRPPP